MAVLSLPHSLVCFDHRSNVFRRAVGLRPYKIGLAHTGVGEGRRRIDLVILVYKGVIFGKNFPGVLIGNLKGGGGWYSSASGCRSHSRALQGGALLFHELKEVIECWKGLPENAV